MTGSTDGGHARLIANARLIAEMWAMVHAVERGLREVGESDFVNSEYVALEQLDGPIREALGKLQAALDRLEANPNVPTPPRDGAGAAAPSGPRRMDPAPWEQEGAA